jgi:hypothetical protein
MKFTTLTPNDMIVNVDALDLEETKEYMNDWFLLYKETSYFDVIEWAKFHFDVSSVNRGSHNFWLDKRGLMLYELKGMIHVTGIFPTF